MKHIDAKDLLERYSQGQCTDDEKALVEAWYNQAGDRYPYDLGNEEIEYQLNTIEASLPHVQRTTLPLRRWLAAAAIIIAVSTVLLFYFRPEMPETTRAAILIPPGGDKATLTLADGRTVVLDDKSAGALAVQAGVKITKAADGQIVYQAEAGSPDKGPVQFNTIETPAGGQYQVKLPDGTHVWLNASSSLRYPVRFGDKERRVEINGEGYFEVAHDKKKPFKVVAPHQEIEVLGTEFNVMAYSDESSVQTSIIGGVVRIYANNSSAILTEGLQSQVTSSSLQVTKDVDMNDVTAWKNGRIQFTNARIESVMRMLSRWYDIEVGYSGQEVGATFGGSMSRKKNLQEVLKVLESTGDVHFKIEGRRVTVMP